MIQTIDDAGQDDSDFCAIISLIAVNLIKDILHIIRAGIETIGANVEQYYIGWIQL